MSAVQDDPELLCYCKTASRAQFADDVRRRPGASFATVCEETGVGMICTSCLLNAEVVFADARRSGGPATAPLPGRTDRSRGFQIPSRGEIVSWLVKQSPLVPGRFESVCPIISADGLATELVVSNAIPTSIGPRSARFAIDVEVRDADGRIAATLDGDIRPGEMWMRDLAAYLPNGNDRVRLGSARIALTARDRGFKGTVRPHFVMRGRSGVAAVHTANASRNHSTPHLFSRRCAGERHFAHVRNCTNVEITCVARISPETGGAAIERTRTLPPFGSAMLDLDGPDRGIQSVLVECTGLQRTWFVTAAADFSKVSVDHV